MMCIRHPTHGMAKWVCGVRQRPRVPSGGLGGDLQLTRMRFADRLGRARARQLQSMLPTRQWSADRLSKARVQGREGYRGEAHHQGWDQDELQDGGQYENGRADEVAALRSML